MSHKTNNNVVALIRSGIGTYSSLPHAQYTIVYSDGTGAASLLTAQDAPTHHLDGSSHLMQLSNVSKKTSRHTSDREGKKRSIEGSLNLNARGYKYWREKTKDGSWSSSIRINLRRGRSTLSTTKIWESNELPTATGTDILTQFGL